MKTPALLLATVTVLLVAQRSTARPTCGCNGASYIKSEKSAHASNSAAASEASNEEVIKSNSACGEFSKQSKSSSSNSVSKSTSSSSESFEAYQAGNICGEALPAKKCGETDIAYYKRIFTVDTSCTESIKTFYAKVFKQYKGETDIEYVKRINFIFTSVYTKLDIRIDEKYVSYLEKYYKISYAKKSSESETEYFKRVLKKTTETEEVYIKKVTILKKYITEVNWNKVKIDAKSCTGYTLVESSSNESTSTAKSVETSKSCESVSEETIKTTYAKTEKEDETTYFKRIISESSKITSSEEFVKTLTTVRKYYPTLSLWYDIKYVDLVKKYYTAVYTKKSSESVEEQFKRIVTKESFETDEQCAERVAIVRELLPNLDLWYDKKYYETYTKKVYQTVYKKSKSEDETKYYQRIISKTNGESDSVYVKRLSLVKQTFSSLDLWYSKKYLTQTSSYYTAKYTRVSNEKDETLFKRIVTKETLETDEQCAQRVEIIRELFPDLVLWSDEKYYETYTKTFYQTVYKKATTEDESTYYKRIVTKSSKESDETYVGRLTLIEKTHKSLALWYSEKYFETVKQFYTLKYAKKSSESEKAYVSRIFETKEACDINTDIFVQRLHLVQLVTASSSIWYNEEYYEKYTKIYYATYYKKIEKDSCDAWLTKVITLLPGECKENAIKRITLIKKSVSACNCWTEETLSKIEKCFDAAYISEIRKCFFVSESITTSSSSSSSSKSKSSSSSEDLVVVKRG